MTDMNNSHDLSGIMENNLKNLKDQMKGIKLDMPPDSTPRNIRNPQTPGQESHPSVVGELSNEKQHGDTSMQITKQGEFDTIPDMLSPTHRSGKQDGLGSKKQNQRDDIQLEFLDKDKDKYQAKTSEFDIPSNLEYSAQNFQENMSPNTMPDEEYESLFPDYSELEIGIDVDMEEDDELPRPAEQLHLFTKKPQGIYYYEKTEELPLVRNEVINDVIMHKNNYHEDRAIDGSEFFTKPFIVVSTNNNLESHKKDYDSISIQSISEMEGNIMFSPKKAHKNKVKALEAIAEQGIEINPAFLTYQTILQNNYKQILLQNTYDQLSDVPEIYPINESPSKTYVKYDQYIPLSGRSSKKKRRRQTQRNENGELIELDKFGSPFKSKKNWDGYDVSPYDRRVGNFNRQVYGGSPNKSVRMDKDGLQKGYGDSIEDIAKRMSAIVGECHIEETKNSKKKLLLSLKHLDRFFKSQYGQMRKTNEELRNFNKLINRKNKNLLLVMETLDNETEKVSSSVKILEEEEDKLSHVLEDKDYYQEIGHKKIQKMNELDEVRRVVKNLNRRLQDRKDELNERRRVNKNLETLSKQIKNTFTQNNSKLRTTLKKEQQDGRIRDVVRQRSSGTGKKKKYFYQSGKKKIRGARSSIKSRTRPSSVKKSRNGSRTKKSRNNSKSKTRTTHLDFQDPELNFGSPEDRIYQGPFVGRDIQNRTDMRDINSKLQETKQEFENIQEKFKNDGLRIYPFDNNSSKRSFKSPNVSQMNNHRAEMRNIMREEINRSRDSQDDFYSSHQRGPLIRSHAVNNPVSFNEKKMRHKVLYAMTYGLEEGDGRADDGMLDKEKYFRNRLERF